MFDNILAFSKTDEAKTFLEEIMTLRQKQAELLSYENHATYIQEVRMAKDPGTVKQFLNDLGAKMVHLWKEEQGVMMRMKEEEAKELSFEFNFWDFRY